MTVIRPKAAGSTLMALAVAGVLTLPLHAQTEPAAPATAPAATAPATTIPAADLMKAEEVIQRAMDAMGGKEKVEAIESTHYRALAKTPFGDVTVSVSAAKGGKLLLQQVYAGGRVTVRIGSDGKTGWKHVSSSGQYVLMDENEVKDTASGADLTGVVLNLAERFPIAQTIDKTMFHDVMCWKVRLVDEKGNEGIGYFEVDSGRYIGLTFVQETANGPAETELFFDLWKPVGDSGVTLFSKLTTSSRGMSQLMEIVDLSFNSVPPETFNLPAEVVTLVEQRASGIAPATQPLPTKPVIKRIPPPTSQPAPTTQP